jgi:hypothetical protein
MSSQPEPLTAFTCFSDLPLELRDKIWEATVDWRSHILPRPSINELAVCREARKVLLMIYRPCFQPFPRRDDSNWNVVSTPDIRRLQIGGMGVSSPRSPYANYETDVLHIFWSMIYGVDQAEVLRQSITEEAIENIQNIVIYPRSWQPRYSSGPLMRVGDHPRPPNPDSRLALFLFGALKNVYIAHEPSVSVTLPPLNEDQQRARRLTRPRPGWNEDDEVLKLAKLTLRSKYPEGKILLPSQEDVNYPFFHIEQVEEWVISKEQEFPEWRAPEVQDAKIIPDPQSCEQAIQDAVDEAIRSVETPEKYKPLPYAFILPKDGQDTT